VTKIKVWNILRIFLICVQASLTTKSKIALTVDWYFHNFLTWKPIHPYKLVPSVLHYHVSFPPYSKSRAISDEKSNCHYKRNTRGTNFPNKCKRRLPRQKCSIMWKISSGFSVLPDSFSSSIIRSATVRKTHVASNGQVRQWSYWHQYPRPHTQDQYKTNHTLARSVSLHMITYVDVRMNEVAVCASTNSSFDTH